MICLDPTQWDLIRSAQIATGQFSLKTCFYQVLGSRSYLAKLEPKDNLGFYMDVSENSGTPKSSILIGFSIINHPFWGTPIFGNTHIVSYPLGDGLGLVV